MQTDQGYIFKIKKFALHDGPGIRTTVFLKGCPLHCWWCHNPESQSLRPQIVAGPRSSPDRQETLGLKVSVDEVLREIEKDVIFYDDSGGGATFSGGEPLLQPEFLTLLLEGCRAREIHTAVDTSGYAPLEIMAAVGAKTDLVLYDLKLMDDVRHKHYTGVSNRPVLDNLTALARSGRDLQIRFPIVPGITDDRDNVEQAAEFVHGLESVEQVALLPLHRIADEKYRRLGLPNRMREVNPPEPETVARIRETFTAYGFQVSVGG